MQARVCMRYTVLKPRKRKNIALVFYAFGKRLNYLPPYNPICI